MGLNPRSLIKNIPSRSEPPKLPVKAWIHDIYEERREKAVMKKARKEQVAVAHPVTDPKQSPEDNTTYVDFEKYISEDKDIPPNSKEDHEKNQAMLHRQEQFRIAAKYVADSLSNIPEVKKVALFGSVAKPLEKRDSFAFSQLRTTHLPHNPADTRIFSPYSEFVSICD